MNELMRDVRIALTLGALSLLVIAGLYGLYITLYSYPSTKMLNESVVSNVDTTMACSWSKKYSLCVCVLSRGDSMAFAPNRVCGVD